MKYENPDLHKNAFNCPHCNAYAQQTQSTISLNRTHEAKYDFLEYKPAVNCASNKKSITLTTCYVCKNFSLWLNDILLFPNKINIEMPNIDMPEKVKEFYMEARSIYIKSPRAACALLRLSIQHLCIFLGEKGSNINTDIGNLVKKGLSSEIQKALDIVRITGNNAVHPGEFEITDNSEIAFSLFKIVNYIIQKMITDKKDIDELYSQLPKGAIEAIEKRDK